MTLSFRYTMLFFVLLALTVSSAFGQARPDPELVKFVNGWGEAFVKQETGKLSSWLDDSPDLIYLPSAGDPIRGRENVSSAFNATFHAMDGLEAQVEWSRIASEGETAWVVLSMNETVQYGTDTLRLGVVQSFTMLKRSVGWRIVMMHESVAAATE